MAEKVPSGIRWLENTPRWARSGLGLGQTCHGCGAEGTGEFGRLGWAQGLKEPFPAALTGHQRVPEVGPGLWGTGGAEAVPEGAQCSGGWGGSQPLDSHRDNEPRALRTG